MGRVNTPLLTASDRSAREAGFKLGDSHCFRNRCHVILLKADGRSSKDVGMMTSMNPISVNSWITRFKSEGISGLLNSQVRVVRHCLLLLTRIPRKTDQNQV